jgi:hypothetical protein
MRKEGVAMSTLTRETSGQVAMPPRYYPEASYDDAPEKGLAGHRSHEVFVKEIEDWDSADVRDPAAVGDSNCLERQCALGLDPFERDARAALLSRSGVSQYTIVGLPKAVVKGYTSVRPRRS